MGHGVLAAARRPPHRRSRKAILLWSGHRGHAGQKVMRTLAQSLPRNLPDHGGAGPREPAAPPLSPPPPPRRPAPARRRGGEGWWVAGTPARARSAVAGRARGYATALGARITTLDGRQVARRSPPRRLARAASRALRRSHHRARGTGHGMHAGVGCGQGTCTCACTDTHIDAGKPKNGRAGAPWTFEGSNLSGSPREPPPRGSSLPHASRGAPRG